MDERGCSSAIAPVNQRRIMVVHQATVVNLLFNPSTHWIWTTTTVRGTAILKWICYSTFCLFGHNKSQYIALNWLVVCVRDDRPSTLNDSLTLATVNADVSHLHRPVHDDAKRGTIRRQFGCLAKLGPERTAQLSRSLPSHWRMLGQACTTAQSQSQSESGLVLLSHILVHVH